MQKGQAVAVKYTLPVMFRLEGGEMKSSRTVEMSRRPGSLLDSALVIVDGKEVTMYVKPGDKVIYSKYAGTEVKLDGEEYTIVRQSDILAVVE